MQQETPRPWWAMPDARVKRATIANDGTTCPICGVVDQSSQLELIFPEQPGKLLGFVLGCGHVIEADLFELAVQEDDQTSGFFGEYPVTIVDQATGIADIIPVRVVPENH